MGANWQPGRVEKGLRSGRELRSKGVGAVVKSINEIVPVVDNRIFNIWSWDAHAIGNLMILWTLRVYVCDILGIMEFEQCPWGSCRKRNLHLGFVLGTWEWTLNVTKLEKEEQKSQIDHVKPSVLTVHSREVPGETGRDLGLLCWRGDRNQSVQCKFKESVNFTRLPCSGP